ncbi:hypothetical protein HG530_003806 [Fusarium avenaceum]|nr:hypothetical protein HG530_003806 [Fusarium avenaceum]
MLRLVQTLFFKIFTLTFCLSPLPNKTCKGILLLSTNVLLIDRLHLTQVMQIGQAIDLSALVQGGIPTDRGEGSLITREEMIGREMQIRPLDKGRVGQGVVHVVLCNGDAVRAGCLEQQGFCAVPGADIHFAPVE